MCSFVGSDPVGWDIGKLARAGVSLAALAIAAGLILPPKPGHADQLPMSAFTPYSPANASSIVAGPFSLYTVSLAQLATGAQLAPTQLNVGFNEVDKKAEGFNILTSAAQVQNVANLLGSIEPVVIGPGGVLYQTDGHHTFRALLDSGWGSDPNILVDVNVIANFSNDTEAQFLAAMEASNLLYPGNDGVFESVNLSNGAPLPSSLLGMTSDPYRGLEYSILKNKASKIGPFTGTSNILGAKGSAIPGIDKMTGFYADFINADSYRGANGGLGLPYLSIADTAISTAWDLKGTNPIVTGTSGGTIPGNYSSINSGAGLEVQDLPGYILPTGLATINPGTVTNATLTNSIANLGAIAADGSFNGLRSMTLGSGGQSVVIGTQQAAGVTGPGFLLQLGNDNNVAFTTDTDSVTLNAGNTYTGGTTIAAGRLIIMADSSLGAAAGTTAISTSSVVAGVEADNGIVFNSLTEGNGTIQLGSSTTPGTNSFTESRAIAVDGEVAAFNLNGNTLTLSSSLSGGQLYSTGALSTGISNADGESDITVEDDSTAANGKLVLGANANPNFYGNWVISTGTLQASNDASLGNTIAPASANYLSGLTTVNYEVGQIELNGGTFQAGASFTSVRNIFLGGGSNFDVNGFNTTFASLQDTQRTLIVENSSSTGLGSLTLGTLEIGGGVATLNVNAGSGTGGGQGTIVNLTKGILRDPGAVLLLQPTTNTTFGTGAGGTEEVFDTSTGANASNKVTNGIVAPWIAVYDNTPATVASSGATNANPLSFATYGANGFVATQGNSTNILTATSTSTVAQSANATLAGNESVYALNVESAASATTVVNLGGHTLTIGDGTNPAGLILNASGGTDGGSSITNGTLAFGGSEGIIWFSGIGGKNTNVISAQITGSGGLTFAGGVHATDLANISKTQGLSVVNITTASTETGQITIDSGAVGLGTATNIFADSVPGILLADTKSSPAPATLNITASQQFSALDSVGNNSAVNVSGAGVQLIIGETTGATGGNSNAAAYNQNSQFLGVLTQTTSNVAGALTIDTTGLVDLSGGGGVTLATGSTVVVNDGALRIGNGVFGASAANAINLAAGTELQYSGNGGSQLNDPITGSGAFHLIDGSVQLTSTGNTYTGGTFIELGSTLQVTPANLPTGGTIVNAGGNVDFDMASAASASFTGVIEDGNEAGGPTDLNDLAQAAPAGGSCSATSNNPQGPACLSGNLIKDDGTDNPGTTGSNLTLTQAQDYTGFTAVEAGILTLGTTDTIKKSSGVILGRVGGNQSGAIPNQQAELALSANNTIQALASNPNVTTTNSNPNVVVALNGHTLTITSPANTANTFGGNITDSGTGQLVFSGQGLEIFDGASMVAGGGTTITSGMLEVGDALSNTTPNSTVLTSNVTVGASGTLLGHGEIIGTVTNTAGGVVAPGGSIGTLTVAGSYSQGANSSLATELNPTTASQLAVTAGSGTGIASIGGTLAVLPDAGSYTRGASYQILTATGGVTGTFANLVNAAPQLDFTAVYKANEVDLLLAGFTPVTNLNPNQQGIFNALSNAPMGSATDALLNNVGSLSAAAQTQALNELSAYSALANVNVMSVGMSSFQDAIGGRASADPKNGSDVKTAQLVTDDWLPIPSNNRVTIWTQGIGQFSTLHGDSQAPGQTTTVGGGVVGIDTALDPTTRVGASFGAVTGGSSAQGVGQSGTVNSYALGLYAGRWYGPIGIDAEAMGAYSTSTSSRFIAINNTTAQGSTSGLGGGVSGAVRYRMELPLATIEPQFGLQYAYSRQDGFIESGAGAADLNVGAVTQNSLKSAAGAEIFHAFSDPAGYTIVPEARAAWLHQFLDTTPHVNEFFAASPSATFSTTGVNQGRDAALLEAGLSFKRPEDNFSFYAQYDATLSSREVDHAIRGGIAIFW